MGMGDYTKVQILGLIVAPYPLGSKEASVVTPPLLAFLCA